MAPTKNGNGVRFRIVAEIVKLGDRHWVAEIVSLSCALAQNKDSKWVKTDKITTRKPLKGDGVKIPNFAFDYIEEFDVGDKVELSVGENITEDSEEKKRMPWWCYFVHTTSGSNGVDEISDKNWGEIQVEALDLLTEIDALDPEYRNSALVAAETDLLSALDNADYRGAHRALVGLKGVLRGIKSAEEKRLATAAEEEARRKAARAVAEAIRNRRRPA